MSYTFSQFGRPFLFYAIYILTATDIFLHMKAPPVLSVGWAPVQLTSPSITSYQKSSPGCSSLLFPYTPPIQLWLHLLFHLQEDEVHMKKVRCFLLPFLFCNSFSLLTFCIPKNTANPLFWTVKTYWVDPFNVPFLSYCILVMSAGSRWNFTICLISKWIWLWLILFKKLVKN